MCYTPSRPFISVYHRTWLTDGGGREGWEERGEMLGTLAEDDKIKQLIFIYKILPFPNMVFRGCSKKFVQFVNPPFVTLGRGPQSAQEDKS